VNAYRKVFSLHPGDEKEKKSTANGVLPQRNSQAE